ncbi:50S ribosomal protein L4 [Candidatus Pacearchaeota archaeon CG10_big_fil_rev_8_21_14_0_10_34_76]|nr:MAG: 50S ribosomal protein L4 [Candidatus Pacearchaeota archaeon CG10_big_fil_rev_8_21_14_0_10_34_76]
MKATLYDITGKKKGEIEMPKLFDNRVREDLVGKYFEVDKFIQPYSPDPRGGRKHSASGTISHKRHDWKGHYGKGISRTPRKTMWRRGTQFFWVGAEVSSTRGGRRAHGPKGIGKEKKINLREIQIAMNSGFAASANKNYILSRYDSLKDLSVQFPIVIESKLEKVKTKEIKKMLNLLFGEMENLVFKNKKVRAGKGKIRGRKYKSNAGLLLVTGNDEDVKVNGIDVKKLGEVKISDLYPLGRLVIYTEKSLSQMEAIK